VAKVKNRIWNVLGIGAGGRCLLPTTGARPKLKRVSIRKKEDAPQVYEVNRREHNGAYVVNIYAGKRPDQVKKPKPAPTGATPYRAAPPSVGKFRRPAPIEK